MDRIFIPTLFRADNQISFNHLSPSLQKKSDCVGGVQLIALQGAVVNYLEEYPSARVLPMYSLFTLAISDEWSCDIPNEALNKMQEKLY